MAVGVAILVVSGVEHACSSYLVQHAAPSFCDIVQHKTTIHLAQCACIVRPLLIVTLQALHFL
jgi:hypothetical protein